MKETDKTPVTAPVESDPCVRSFDPESHRFGDEDDACMDGERPPTYRTELARSMDGKTAR
jgi:hypothetical protein